MTATEKFLVQCLKCALKKEKIKQIPAGVDFKALFLASVQHSVVVMLYYALEDVFSSTPEVFQQSVQMAVLKSIKKSERINYDQKQILNALENSKIEHLPLKGYYIKKLYPTTEMRYASDVDILIKPSTVKKVHKVFASLGYVKQKNDTHHDVYYNPNTKTIFEMHKSLFAHELNKHFNKEFEKASLVEGTNYLYNYNASDLFISVICHYAYHFKESAGVGLRALCDIIVILEEYKTVLDYNYINSYFEKCGVKTFYNEFIKLIDYLFYDKPCSEFTIVLAEYVFSCSLLENEKYAAVNTITKEQEKEEKKAKNKAIVRKIFPKKEAIYYLYPWTKKVKILLPLGYVARWLHVIFKKPKRMKVLFSINNVSKEEYEKMKYIKSGLGLDGTESQVNR